MSSIYDRDLEQNTANYQPLTPLTFLERAAAVFPERSAIIYGDLHINYADFYRRCRQLASALQSRGKSTHRQGCWQRTPLHID